MAVLSIRKMKSKKPGRIVVCFEVDEAAWRSMTSAAKDGAFPDTLDYIAGQINMALIGHAPAEPAKGPIDTDMDDGIPF